MGGFINIYHVYISIIKKMKKKKGAKEKDKGFIP